MTIKPAGHIVTDEARHAIDAVKGCVTPIFDVNEKREAELLGSAVLIEIAEELFLCTAKHVIDDNKDSTLRSEEHTYELQSLMRISYAVFCLKKNHIQISSR